jgi:hypothetical protein
MDETRIIRGRKVIFERRDPVETLRYSLDVFDAGDNLIEGICLRQVCRVIRSSDRDR